MSLSPPPELAAKWRTRAPRYTSYPSAPHFHPLDPDDVDAAHARVGPTLAFYVHVPFCRSLCHYCGCHVEVRTDRTRTSAPYVDRLLDELATRAILLPEGRGLGQLAIGGGTPTWLLPDDLARLVGTITTLYAPTPDAERSIEIDPRTVDTAMLERLVELGFDRFSVGVQDLNVEVVSALNRHQTPEQVGEAIDTLRGLGISGINIDLMYGLPGQTPEGFQRTLDDVVTLNPSRIALFLYAHVPWMKPAQKLVEKKGLPDAQVRAELFARAVATFEGAGWRRIGLDHFARPGDELLIAQANGTLQRNFMGYTTKAGLDLVPLGPSAIGYLGGTYVQNEKDRPAWEAAVRAGRVPTLRGHTLDAEDQLRKRVILDLSCNFHATISPFERVVLAESLAALAPLAADGIVTLDPEGVRITALGRHFVRNVCAAFDAYLVDDGALRHSMTA